MAYDSLVLSAVISELNSLVLGSRIEKIYQPNKTDIVISTHSRAGKHRIFLSSEARTARVNLTHHTRENPLTPPVFCMVLRKHLDGGKITGISQPDFERIIHFHIENMDELGRLSEKLLICEIMGKHSNIVLVDKTTNNVIDGITRFSHAVNRYREVLPGRPYTPPPTQGKRNPLLTTEEDFKNLLWNDALEKSLTLDKWLLQSYTGFSPLTCKEIVFRSGLDRKTMINTVGEFEMHQVWTVFSKIIEETNSSNFKPTLVFQDGKVKDFSAIDLSHFDGEIKSLGTMNEILDQFYQAKYEQLIFAQLKEQISKKVSEEIGRNQKKLRLYDENIAKAESAEEYRINGEILTANLYMLEPYQTEVTLTNFYDPEQKETTIKLDPSLTPSENAQAYFKKYTKAKAGRDAALKLSKDLKEELSYLETVAAAIDQAGKLEDLKEIKTELVDQGYIKEKIDKRRKKQPSESHPYKFTTKDNWIIFVGKNNKQNDWLTLKKAKSTDTWLHVKDIPGSHVIISGQDTQVPEDMLNTAALLAAYFSKARNSSNVPVDYTLCKHVHKPSGAKPGMVIYENQRTLFVTPPRELSELQSLEETTEK